MAKPKSKSSLPKSIAKLMKGGLPQRYALNMVLQKRDAKKKPKGE